MDTLVKMTSRAWSLDILALMQGGTPGRQAVLLAATGAGRTAFTQSLHHLIDQGLVERNYGHGHPLRPEYRLTPKGADLAVTAHRITGLIPQPTERRLIRRTWTIPVLAVSQYPRHFSDIRGALDPITDRALSQSLKHLRDSHWLERTFDVTANPPRPLYQAVGTGARIGRAVGLSAR